MRPLLALLALSGGWYDTVPPDGVYAGDVYWVQNYNLPWDWEPIQFVGTVRVEIANRQIAGYMDLPVHTVQWLDRLAYPVRFFDEKTPPEWRESSWCPWLFRVWSLGTSAPIRTGWRGQYTPYNIHAEWLYGISCLGEVPGSGLSFRWRNDGGSVVALVYGYWAAFPSKHAMSLGWAMRSE